MANELIELGEAMELLRPSVNADSNYVVSMPLLLL